MSDITERLEDEEFQALIEHSTDLITILDADGTIVYESPSIERILGYKQDELIGENAFEYVHPDDRQKVMTEFTKAVEDPDITPTAEYRFKHSDGSWRWIESVGNNRLHDSAVEGFVVNSRDITDRKEREEALEALHDVAVELGACETEDEIYDITVETAEKILDFDICVIDLVEGDKLVTKAVSSGVSDEGYYETTPLSRDDNLGVRTYKNGESYVVDDLYDTEVEPADEAYRSVISVPVGDMGVFQAVSKSVGNFSQDDLELSEILISHVAEGLRRIRSERGLKREKERFASLFRNVPSPVIYGEINVNEGEPRIITVNPAFEEVFGYDAEDVEGKNLNDVVVPPGREEEAVKLDSRVIEQGELRTEVRRETSEGLRDFLLHVSLSEVNEDTLEGYSIYTDITERKRRERELKRQNERLEEFASVVSHDIRNPLNVARGYVELALDTGETENLGKAIDAFDRADAIIEDVLTLARQGRTVGEAEEIDIESVVMDCWGNIDTHDTDVRIEIVDDLGTIEADRGRLSQLFENLFDNSVEHGGESVRIRVGSLGDGFYVEDDGPGIPEDELEKIFDHGYSTADEGTGFGLSIVKSIADAHGWNITAKNTKNQGARFEVTGATQV